MSSNEFVKLCRDISALSETVRIEVSGKVANFIYQGKSGAGKVTLKKNQVEKEESQVNIRCEEPYSASFGLQYLNSFAKASCICQRVSINLSSQFPLMIHYDIEKLGYLKFYLAPKVDEDQN
jgi:proliferating cell nuclear antigen